MIAQSTVSDEASSWRRVLFFRSAPYDVIEKILADSLLAEALFDDVTLVVQEDAVNDEVQKLFGERVRIITIPPGPFSLDKAPANLLTRLRELDADAFIIFYNNTDRQGYGDIETLALLSGASVAKGIGPDNRLTQVMAESGARKRYDPLLRWRSSPDARSAADNFLSYLRNFRGASEEVSKTFPWYMYVELSRNCNLRCPGCRPDEATAFTDMPLAGFARFIDDVGPYLYQMVLYRGGESLINKRFFEMLEYAYKKSGAQLILSSNMSHRLAYSDLERIVQYCDLVDVTIDGLTPKTYGEYRVRGNFDLAFANLMKLARLAESPDSNCHIRWRFIVFSYNEHEVDEARRIAVDIGVELQLVRPQVQRVGEGRDALELLPEDTGLWRPEYGDKPLMADMSVRCGWLHGGAALNHNMSLSPCCELQREFTGDIGGAFSDAYCNDEYSQARHKIICDGCSVSGRNEWNSIFDSFERQIIHFLLSGDLLSPSDRRFLMEPPPGSLRGVNLSTGQKENV